jgi:hypothetical protein
MRQERGRNHATALFGVHQLPSDQQIGNLLDPVPPEHLAPLLMDTVDGRSRLGALAAHRALAGGWLLALDGTPSCAAHASSCPRGFARTLANGATQYHPMVVTPGVGRPGPGRGVPTAPGVRHAAGWPPQAGL